MSQVSEKSTQVKQGDNSLTLSEKSIITYPSPDILAGYERVKAGYADRLMAMAEKEQDERINREKSKRLLATKRENTTRWGLIIGLIVTLPIYATSAYAFNLDHAVKGSRYFGSTLANLAGIFVARKTGLFDDKKE